MLRSVIRNVLTGQSPEGFRWHFIAEALAGRGVEAVCEHTQIARGGAGDVAIQRQMAA
jgi:hypothetical protein